MAFLTACGALAGATARPLTSWALAVGVVAVGVAVLGVGLEVSGPETGPFWTQWRSVPSVRAPAVPLAGLRWAARWKRVTAALVPGPKSPSAVATNPTWE